MENISNQEQWPADYSNQHMELPIKF